MTVVPLYAALLALLFVLLSVRVIGARRSGGIALGVAGDAGLERRVRVQANFAEYVPLALLLLAMAELRGVSAAFLLHPLCLCLLLGRLAHAWGVSRTPENYRYRVAGMAGTLTAIVGGAFSVILA